MMLTHQQIDDMTFEELCAHLHEHPEHTPLAIIRISRTSFDAGERHGSDKMMRMMMNIQTTVAVTHESDTK